jgi:hypothetical protein
LCTLGARGGGIDGYAGGDGGGAGADELTVDFDEAGVAGLDGSEVRLIADLGERDGGAIEDVYEALAGVGLEGGSVDPDLAGLGGGGVVLRSGGGGLG